MKISPLPSTGMTIGNISAGATEAVPSAVRSLRMATNATPGMLNLQQVAQELTLPDASQDVTDPAIEVTKPLSPQLAAIAKQRRALQVKERELLEKEKALSNPANSIALSRLKEQPLSALLEAGVTYDQLTEAILANQSGINPEIQTLKEEIKALREGVDKNFTDRDLQAKTQVLAEMKRDAIALSQAGDDFEMVRETRSIPQVMQLIERTYDTTGEILDVAEALRLYEEELVKDSLKIAAIKKVQSRLAPAPAPVPAPQSWHRQMRTLTNKDTATPPMDRKQRALAAFSGQLKK